MWLDLYRELAFFLVHVVLSIFGRVGDWQENRTLFAIALELAYLHKDLEFGLLVHLSIYLIMR